MEKVENDLRICSKNDVHFQLTLRRFSIFGEDAANAFDGHIFRKVFEYDGAMFLLSLFEKEDDIRCAIDPSPEENSGVLKEAKRIAAQVLGLRFSLREFYDFAKSDATIQEHVSKYRGLRPTLSPTGFEMLVTSITAQQINLKFAFTIRTRMIREFGEKLEKDGVVYHAFPTPETLSEVKIEPLRAMQFSTRKAEYVIGLARSIVRDGLDLEALADKPEEEISAALLPLRGIGRWSVDWFLARYLGRGSAFPAGDLAVKRVVEKHFFSGERGTEPELREFAGKHWGNFTNLIVHYLLAGLS